jgi:pimeloyl-ACP methyl ester carboxylesterase
VGVVTTGFAPVAGGRLWFEAAGSGPAVVLLHAGICDRRMWDDQFGLFAERYRVVRYDMRGHGESDVPGAPFSPRRDLAELLGFLGIERAWLVGVSAGARLDADTALELSGLVAGLVLAAPAVSGYAEWSEGVRRSWKEEDDALQAGDVDAAVETNLRTWVDGPARRPDQVDPAVRARVGEMQRQIFSKPPPTAGPQRLEPPAIVRLGEIAVPTLVVWGDRDQPDIVAIAERLASAIPGAERRLIHGVAHVPNMERPAEFNRPVLDFLARRAAD